ncbi:MAG: HRDC domain-containing protein [Bacteroidia bacterium]|nr:HRDC domain-containing protein [Bacteroidia bacterium]
MSQQVTSNTTINIRPAAEALIKTVLLLDRPYGFSYLTNITRGDDQFLKQQAHRELETFGELEEENFGFVQDVAWYLIRAGYLTVANKQFGTISATIKGESFLEEQEKLEVEKEVLRMQWFHLLLTGELRDLRRKEAEAAGKEPYEIFTNFMMMGIARLMPADEGALRRIPGLDKIDKTLAEKILSKIANTSQEMVRDEELYGAISKAYSGSHRKVKEMFESGIEVDEIARRQNIKTNTLYGYLENLHLAGHINIKPWIEDQVDGKVLHRGTDYFKQAKSNRLTDAHDVLGLDFETLRLCRVYARPLEEPAAEYKKAS